MPISLPEVQSGYNLSLINDNFQTIESAWDEKLDRLVSDQGNEMEQDLDMNSNRILNHPEPQSPTDLVRLKDIFELKDFTGYLPYFTRYIADGITTEYALPIDATAIATSVYIDGLRQLPGIDYDAEEGLITFFEAPPLYSVIALFIFTPTEGSGGGPTPPPSGGVTITHIPTQLGDGVKTVFDAGSLVLPPENFFVFIDGIKQIPTTDYTSPSNIVFTEAPALGAKVDITSIS